MAEILLFNNRWYEERIKKRNGKGKGKGIVIQKTIYEYELAHPSFSGREENAGGNLANIIPISNKKIERKKGQFGIIAEEGLMRFEIPESFACPCEQPAIGSALLIQYLLYFRFPSHSIAPRRDATRRDVFHPRRKGREEASSTPSTLRVHFTFPFSFLSFFSFPSSTNPPYLEPEGKTTLGVLFRSESKNVAVSLSPARYGVKSDCSQGCDSTSFRGVIPRPADATTSDVGVSSQESSFLPFSLSFLFYLDFSVFSEKSTPEQIPSLPLPTPSDEL